MQEPEGKQVKCGKQVGLNVKLTWVNYITCELCLNKGMKKLVSLEINKEQTKPKTQTQEYIYCTFNMSLPIFAFRFCEFLK